MPYKVSHSPSFNRDIKSFKKDRHISDLIKQKVLYLIENPTDSEQNKGNLSGLRKFKFNHHPEYRIIFRLYQCCSKSTSDTNNCVALPDDDILPDNCTGLIQFLYVKTREECNNLYAKHKKALERDIFDGMIVE